MPRPSKGPLATGPRAVPRKPTLTPSVMNGLLDLLDAVPVSFLTTKERLDAVQYIRRLSAVLRSPAYLARQAHKNEITKASPSHAAGARRKRK